MKVLFVCTTGGSGRRQLGGAERMLTELVPAHARTGVDVVAATSDDEVGRSLREAGVPWVGLGATSRIDLGYAREIRRLVREVKPDVVCAHLLSAAMHARAALSLDRTPLVVTLHNSLWQYRDTAGSWQQKAAIQSNITLDLAMRRLRPHATVAVSEFEATELRERGRVRNIHLIPNPLPADWPAPKPADAPAPGRRPVVGYLGRLEREKGADLLAETAAHLPEMDVKVAGAGSLPIAARPNLELVGRVSAADFLRASTASWCRPGSSRSGSARWRRCPWAYRWCTPGPAAWPRSPGTPPARSPSGPTPAPPRWPPPSDRRWPTPGPPRSGRPWPSGTPRSTPSTGA